MSVKQLCVAQFFSGILIDAHFLANDDLVFGDNTLWEDTEVAWITDRTNDPHPSGVHLWSNALMHDMNYDRIYQSYPLCEAIVVA